MISEAMRHARENVAKVSDPNAQALFETSAEVLGGLTKAYTTSSSEARLPFAEHSLLRTAWE